MRRILIADDTPTVRQVIGDSLRRLGYEIAEAGNIDEVRRQIEALAPDAVIIDDLGGGGVAFADELHQSGRKVINISVIRGKCAPHLPKNSGEFVRYVGELAAEIERQLAT